MKTDSFPTHITPKVTSPRPQPVTQKVRGCTGLENTGVTCYVNTALQLLHGCDVFRDHAVLSFVQARPWSPAVNIMQDIYELMFRMQGTEKLAICPSGLLAKTELVGQHDACELLLLLLNAMSDPFVRHLFNVETISTVRCLECDGISPSHRELHKVIHVPLGNGTENLQDLLNMSFRAETLTGNNKYECEGDCKRLTDARRYMSIVNAPEAVIMCLNRFSAGGKIMTNVAAPATLNLPKVAD